VSYHFPGDISAIGSLPGRNEILFRSSMVVLVLSAELAALRSVSNRREFFESFLVAGSRGTILFSMAFHNSMVAQAQKTNDLYFKCTFLTIDISFYPLDVSSSSF